MTDDEISLPAGPDMDLVLTQRLAQRLRDLAAAAAEADGLEGQLARRGFAALVADIAAVLPFATRAAFVGHAGSILREAQAGRPGAGR